MSIYQFIFSNKPKQNLARHALFWIAYYAYILFANLGEFKIKNFTDSKLYEYSFVEAVLYLPGIMLSVYFTVYYFLPKYLTKKNLLSLFIASSLLTFVTAAGCYFSSEALLKIYNPGFTEFDVFSKALQMFVSTQVTISGAAVGIAIMKDYVLKQRENERLVLDNLNNKLQLLKIKMHPDILFACLQNIYAAIDNENADALQMILKLSDLLSYLLYQTEGAEVALLKELQMIGDYLDLKKLEYKNRLEIYFYKSGDINNCYIIPGLFLPILEMSFINSNINDVIGLSVECRTDESKLYFNLKSNFNGNKIMNTSFAQTTLENIKNKLQIFHAHNYRIKVDAAENNLAIALEIDLKKAASRIVKEQGTGYEYA